MKRIFTLLLLVSAITLTGCNKEGKRNRTEEEEEEEIVIDTTADKLTDEELVKFPSYFVQRLSSFKSYKSVTKGQTTSQALFININQSIDTTAIKGDYSYLKNESHSDMHNIVHTAYYHNKQSVYKDNNAQYKNVSIEEYLKKYGTYPFERSIEGYSITEESIVSVTREESETDYTFKVVFDKDKSTNNIKIQMKQFGSLDDYPKFKRNTTMKITVKQDFTPVSIVLSAGYVATKVFDAECNQNYTVTYSNFDEEIEIPNLSEVQTMFI